jgi:putative phosphoribosyl transferase
MSHQPHLQRFDDRSIAGRALAQKLIHHRDDPHAIVLALPRGGVPVALEVARTLRLPLDVLVVRKLGAPGHEELAVGAIAAHGGRMLNEHVLASIQVSQQELELVEASERAELERRERTYRGERPFPNLRDRVVILVDDGMATGASMLAAVHAVQMELPARLIVAVPTAPADACRAVAREVNELHCILRPDLFWAVGLWYRHFPQVSDQEVVMDLAQPTGSAVQNGSH